MDEGRRRTTVSEEVAAADDAAVVAQRVRGVAAADAQVAPQLVPVVGQVADLEGNFRRDRRAGKNETQL